MKNLPYAITAGLLLAAASSSAQISAFSTESLSYQGPGVQIAAFVASSPTLAKIQNEYPNPYWNPVYYGLSQFAGPYYTAEAHTGCSIVSYSASNTQYFKTSVTSQTNSAYTDPSPFYNVSTRVYLDSGYTYTDDDGVEQYSYGAPAYFTFTVGVAGNYTLSVVGQKGLVAAGLIGASNPSVSGVLSVSGDATTNDSLTNQTYLTPGTYTLTVSADAYTSSGIVVVTVQAG